MAKLLRGNRGTCPWSPHETGLTRDLWEEEALTKSWGLGLYPGPRPQ